LKITRRLEIAGSAPVGCTPYSQEVHLTINILITLIIIRIPRVKRRGAWVGDLINKYTLDENGLINT
jgi:hypothetical protein